MLHGHGRSQPLNNASCAICESRRSKSGYVGNVRRGERTRYLHVLIRGCTSRRLTPTILSNSGPRAHFSRILGLGQAPRLPGLSSGKRVYAMPGIESSVMPQSIPLCKSLAASTLTSSTRTRGNDHENWSCILSLSGCKEVAAPALI